MTNKRLQEIVDSVNFQLDICQNLKYDDILAHETKELLDYTLELKQLYDKAVADDVIESKNRMNLEKIIDETRQKVLETIEIIQEQPSDLVAHDDWIVKRLKGLLFILNGDNNE